MISHINITTLGAVVTGKFANAVNLPFKEHKNLLIYTEEFFKLLLSLELHELEFKNLACLNCGFCCKYFSPISVNHEEILRLATFLNLTVKEFKEKYTDIHPGWPNEGRVITSVKDESVKRCIFLKKEPDSEIYLCSVHPARPEACKAYAPSPVFLTCRNLWRSKWEKINNVILCPDEMIVYVANEPAKPEPARIKYRDVPIIMNIVSTIRNYAQEHMPEEGEVSFKSFLGGLMCIKCGNCCIFREVIPLNAADMKNLAEFLNCNEETVRKTYTDTFTDWEGEKLTLKKEKCLERFEWCCFLQKMGDKNCQVYEARPQACKEFITGMEKRFCSSCRSLGVDYP